MHQLLMRQADHERLGHRGDPITHACVCVAADKCYNKVRNVIFDGQSKGPVFSREYGPGKNIFKVGKLGTLCASASWPFLLVRLTGCQQQVTPTHYKQHPPAHFTNGPDDG